MKKHKYLILIMIIALIFSLGAVFSFMVLNAPKKNTVRIKSDGKVLYTLDLSREPNRTFEVAYNGSSNTIEIKDGKIRVSHAECPDKTCVGMGWLDSAAMPIVCLPNRLVIEFVDADGGVDTISE